MAVYDSICFDFSCGIIELLSTSLETPKAIQRHFSVSSNKAKEQQLKTQSLKADADGDRGS